MAGVDYRYELRGGDEVVATVHRSREETLEVGDRIEVGGQLAIARAIEPLLGQPELRLVLRLWGMLEAPAELLTKKSASRSPQDLSPSDRIVRLDTAERSGLHYR